MRPLILHTAKFMHHRLFLSTVLLKIFVAVYYFWANDLMLASFLQDRKGNKMQKILTHSTADLSRQHYLLSFSQQRKCGWENI
jgi:hypothetical protein